MLVIYEDRWLYYTTSKHANKQPQIVKRHNSKRIVAFKLMAIEPFDLPKSGILRDGSNRCLDMVRTFGTAWNVARMECFKDGQLL